MFSLNLKHLSMLSLDDNQFYYWIFRMTVPRFLTPTGEIGLYLYAGCVRYFKTLVCVKFSVGFLRISLNNVRVRQFTNITISGI